MTHINDVPASVTEAGLLFNYDLWTPGTTIQLCHVPWDSGYANIVNFETQADLVAYLTANPAKFIEFNRVSYARPGEPVLLDIPLNQAWQYNYMRVVNNPQPIPGDVRREFYYFINNVSHVAPNTTAFDIQLDVWQSFGRTVQFGRTFVERGHIGIAAENAFDDGGRWYLTCPEGLDYGTELGVYDDEKHVIHFGNGKNTNQKLSLVVAASADLGFPPGDVNAPAIRSSGGTKIYHGELRFDVGCDLAHLPTSWDFFAILQGLKDKPWVSRSILSTIITPYFPPKSKSLTRPFRQLGVPTEAVYNEHPFREYETVISGSVRNRVEGHIPSRYRHLRKFLVSPYTMLELTTFNATPVMLKPENLNTRNAGGLRIKVMMNTLPPSPKIAVVPLDYNVPATSNEKTRGEYLDMVTLTQNLPQLPIPNDNYINFMASNRHSLAYQHQSADWSQQRALMGANTEWANASLMGQNTLNQNVIARNLNEMREGFSQEMNNLSAIASVPGHLMQLGRGDVAGAVGGGMGTAMNWALNQRQIAGSSAITRHGLLESGMANFNTQMGIRDNNYSLAQKVAKGDYANTIAGISAKVQDAQMIPPTISGQLGGEAFNMLLEGGFAVYARYRSLSYGSIVRLGEFWLRYGYAMNVYVDELKPMVMTNFTYWKCQDVTIKHAVAPETYRATIRGIFERGTTVWREPDMIHSLDTADNKPLKGIRL